MRHPCAVRKLIRFAATTGLAAGLAAAAGYAATKAWVELFGGGV